MRIVRYADGTLVDVSDTAADATSYGMQVAPAQLMASFIDVAGDIKNKIDVLGEHLTAGVTGPKEICLEFGVELEGSAGLPILARGSAGCHLLVRARWIKEV